MDHVVHSEIIAPLIFVLGLLVLVIRSRPKPPTAPPSFS